MLKRGMYEIIFYIDMIYIFILVPILVINATVLLTVCDLSHFIILYSVVNFNPSVHMIPW